MQTKIEVEKGHYVSCAVLKKIDLLKILHVVKLPIYSDRAHRDESNGLITGKKQHNLSCAVLPPYASIVETVRYGIL